jgi:hypothetical protein
MDEENLKILGLIVNKLVALGKEDISSFRTDKTSTYEEFVDGEGHWVGDHFKHWWLEWNPSRHSWKRAECDHNESIEIKYVFGRNLMIVKMGWDEEAHIQIGGGSANKDIKREFVKLCRAIEQWEKVEMIREKRAKLVKHVTGIFPDILDYLILEENYEEDEESKEAQSGDES